MKLTLSMSKRYDLTDSFKVAFYSSKPHSPMLSFLRNLILVKYGNLFATMPINDHADFLVFLDVSCVKDTSLASVQGAQVIFGPHYSPDTFWTNEVQ